MTAKKRKDTISDIQEFNIDIEKREIWLHGHYSEENEGVEYKMATKFEKNLRFLDTINNEPILIHMHSDGGSWYDGLGIYDAIKACKSQTTILVYSHATSMSGILLQAANYRVMMPLAFFMLHHGTFGIEAHDANNLKSNVTKMLSDMELMVNLYLDRCKDAPKFEGMKPGKIKKILTDKMQQKGEWYLNAREAVEMGLACAVLGDPGFETIDLLKTQG